jgi:putative heme-binding domain-containing protein
MKSLLLLSAVVCLFVPSLGAQELKPPKALENPTTEDLTRGRQLFATQCVGCHGVGGTGGRGPALTRPKLRHAQDDQTLVDVIFNGLPGTGMGPSWQLSDRELVQVAAYVRSLGAVEPEVLPGDPARGRELFEGKAGCTACHIVGGVGTGLGPDLSEIGALRGGAHLRESLVEPAASRPEQPVLFEPRSFAAYVVVEAVTREGREIHGHRVNEDTFTIQIREADGHLHSLRKAELATLAQARDESPMPAYGEMLEADEIDDLVAFMASLRGE